jgi:hypothetical protein
MYSVTLALDGGEWSASQRAPGTHWIGGWVGPRASLDMVVKRRIPSSYMEQTNPKEIE